MAATKPEVLLYLVFEDGLIKDIDASVLGCGVGPYMTISEHRAIPLRYIGTNYFGTCQ